MARFRFVHIRIFLQVLGHWGEIDVSTFLTQCKEW